MTERKYLRMRAICLARDSGSTWAEIGRRHGISGQRAQQIYRDYNWPTDVMEKCRQEWREKFEALS
jgi:DNA-directed RNA polymerase sigma subunit (sigma70/sigma32)